MYWYYDDFLLKNKNWSVILSEYINIKKGFLEAYWKYMVLLGYNFLKLKYYLEKPMENWKNVKIYETKIFDKIELYLSL